MVNVSASSFSQMALRHFLQDFSWNIVLGTFVLLRLQQPDLNAVEHIQKIPARKIHFCIFILA